MVSGTPATRPDFRVWRRFTTRWTDNDVYGHVNNAIFYQWFDSAVNGWLIDEGLLNAGEGEAIALVVETRCTYFAPLEYPAEVDVGFAIAELGRSSMRYRLGVFAAETEQPAAQGEFVHVLVDRLSRRPMPLPDAWRSALEAIAAA